MDKSCQVEILTNQKITNPAFYNVKKNVKVSPGWSRYYPQLISSFIHHKHCLVIQGFLQYLGNEWKVCTYYTCNCCCGLQLVYLQAIIDSSQAMSQGDLICESLFSNINATEDNRYITGILKAAVSARFSHSSTKTHCYLSLNHEGYTILQII